MVRVAVALLMLLLPSATWAQAEKRIALVITNQAYTQAGARLTNTHRDGDVVKAALERVGFKVWVVKDTANERTLLQAVGEHVQRLAEAGPEAAGFFYYSGHGAADRPNGENYLIPTDVPLTHVSQLPLMAMRLEKITSTLASAGRMSFVVFDACRNVPLQRDTKDLAFKGFAPVREQNGLLVAFATEPGNLAVDQSLYAKALAEEMVRPGMEAGQVFRRVRLRVRADTGQAQSPEYLDKRDQDFHFAAAVSPTGPAAQADRSEMERAWAFIKETEDQSRLEEFIRQFRDSPYAEMARERIAQLKRAKVGVAVPPSSSPPAQSVPPSECDLLAASPLDTNAVTPGVEVDSLDHVHAVPACEEAVAKHPEVARLRFQLGRAYRAKGDNDRAIADYNKAIQLDPKYASAYLNRGSTYLAKGDNDRAITDYTKAIEIDPKKTNAYAGRGMAYRAKGDLDRAISDYTEAIEFNPKHPGAYNNRANAYRAKGDNDRAIADYNKAIEINPKSANAYFSRGRAHRDKGNKDRAIADFRQTLAIDPKHESASAELERLGASK